MTKTKQWFEEYHNINCTGANRLDTYELLTQPETLQTVRKVKTVLLAERTLIFSQFLTLFS
jgi:hypothetical protein